MLILLLNHDACFARLWCFYLVLPSPKFFCGGEVVENILLAFGVKLYTFKMVSCGASKQVVWVIWVWGLTDFGFGLGTGLVLIKVCTHVGSTSVWMGFGSRFESIFDRLWIGSDIYRVGLTLNYSKFHVAQIVRPLWLWDTYRRLWLDLWYTNQGTIHQSKLWFCD